MINKKIRFFLFSVASFNSPAYAADPSLCASLRMVSVSIMAHRQLDAEKNKLIQYWREKRLTLSMPISDVTERIINSAYAYPRAEADEEIKRIAVDFGNKIHKECMSAE